MLQWEVLAVDCYERRRSDGGRATVVGVVGGDPPTDRRHTVEPNMASTFALGAESVYVLRLKIRCSSSRSAASDASGRPAARSKSSDGATLRR